MGQYRFKIYNCSCFKLSKVVYYFPGPWINPQIQIWPTHQSPVVTPTDTIFRRHSDNNHPQCVGTGKTLGNASPSHCDSWQMMAPCPREQLLHSEFIWRSFLEGTQYFKNINEGLILENANENISGLLWDIYEVFQEVKIDLLSFEPKGRLLQYSKAVTS